MTSLAPPPSNATSHNVNVPSSKKSGGMKGILTNAGIEIRRRFSSKAAVGRKTSLLKKKEEAQSSSRLETRSLNDELGALHS